MLVHSVIENDGVFKVTVTDIANASQGVALNDYSANVEFDVEDTADAIAANATNLGKADEVFVSGGDVTISLKLSLSRVYQDMMQVQVLMRLKIVRLILRHLTDGHSCNAEWQHSC